TAKSIRTESAAETQRAREEGWFLNERWTRPDQGGGSILPGNTSFGSEVTYDVLNVTPPDGHPRRLFLNHSTGFIERVVYDTDHGTVEDPPGTWKKLAGRKRASVYAAPTLAASDKPIERIVVDSAW